jgi:aminoglycoside phosphotransferase (APT) family kinase protein
MVSLNARFAGLLADRPGVPVVDLHLTSDGPGFCLHQPLAGHSPRTARLLDWIHEVGAVTPPVTGTDLVHLDYQPGNVLVDNGRVSGVVDFDGASRGDRHLDLVTLRFDLTRRAPHLTGIVDEHLTTADPDMLRGYWAHMSLRMVDWMIRHYDTDHVDTWLTVAESGMHR